MLSHDLPSANITWLVMFTKKLSGRSDFSSVIENSVVIDAALELRLFALKKVVPGSLAPGTAR